MGRHRKDKPNIRLTTVNVSTDTLDFINQEKRKGETQDECLQRVFYQYNDIKEITDNYVFLQDQYENQTRLTKKYVQENEELKHRLSEFEHPIHNTTKG